MEHKNNIYSVEITEVRSAIITVDASNDKEAQDKARDIYNDGSLEVNTLDSVSFEVLETRNKK